LRKPLLAIMTTQVIDCFLLFRMFYFLERKKA
jgi:hypothetical protein